MTLAEIKNQVMFQTNNDAEDIEGRRDVCYLADEVFGIVTAIDLAPACPESEVFGGKKQVLCGNGTVSLPCVGERGIHRHDDGGLRRIHHLCAVGLAARHSADEGSVLHNVELPGVAAFGRRGHERATQHGVDFLTLNWRVFVFAD